LALNDNGLQFGPVGWNIAYTKYRGAGTAQGQLTWAPALAFGLSFYTDPITVEQWRNMELSGFANLDSGVLKLTALHAKQGMGQLDGNAEISEKKKSVPAAWKAVRLDPAGVRGTTDGNVDLQWNAADFSDISGTGRVAARTEYGNGTSDVRIHNAKA